MITAIAVAGTQALRGAGRPMVAKYSNTGKRVWRRLYARVAEGEVADVAFDRTGDIYAAASFRARSGRRGILILKYGPRGGLRWARSHRAAFAQTYEAAKLVVDRRGGVIVLGTSRGGWDGPSGVVVLKYRKNGERTWGPVRCDLDPGCNRSSADLALAVDRVGDIYPRPALLNTERPASLQRRGSGAECRYTQDHYACCKRYHQMTQPPAPSPSFGPI